MLKVSYLKKYISITLLSVCISAGSIASGLPAKPISLPLHISEDRVIVEVSIGELEAQHFIIDMAASGSVISHNLKNKLSITPDEIKIDTVQGASGMRLMEFADLPEVRFARRTFNDLDAVAFETNTFREYDGVNVQGILGVDVLQHFDLRFDLSNKEIQLTPLHKHVALTPENETAIPFESNAMPGFVEFKVNVNGKTMNAFLDTGGKQSILNWKAAQVLEISRNDPKVMVRESGTSGIDGGKQETFLYTFEQLKVGPASLFDTEVKIADLPVFEVMGYLQEPVILIGIDFLHACNIEISYSANTIDLCVE